MSYNFKPNQSILLNVLNQKNNKKVVSLDCVKNKCHPPLNFNYWNTTKLEQYYKKVSRYKEDRRKDFSKNKWFYNSKTNEYVKMKNIELTRMLENQQKQIQFGIQQIQEENKDKIGLFLTITLPGEYHSRTKGKINKNFNKYTIKKGYKVLNETITTIRKKISKRLGISLPYVKIVEPHKDYTPHLHIQFWVEDFHYNQVKQYIENTIVLKQNNNELGTQYKIEKIEKKELSNVSSYITKYLLKTMDNSKHSSKVEIIDGWKRDNKIRMFSTSRLTLPKKLYNNITNLIEEDIKKEGYENLGEYSLKNIKYISVINKKTTIKNNIKNNRYIIKKQQETYINEKNIIDLEVRYRQLELSTYKDFTKKHSSTWWSILTLEEKSEVGEFEGFNILNKILKEVLEEVSIEKLEVWSKTLKEHYDIYPYGG